MVRISDNGPGWNKVKRLSSVNHTTKTIHHHHHHHQNKSTSGTIPTKVLHSLAKEICIPLTDCINSAILNGKFPSELKVADVIPIFKRDDSFEKANYRPISLLPSLSKVYEKLIYQQLNAFFENKLSPLLWDFRSRYSTQHAL